MFVEYHVAISVDIDRFSDSSLVSNWSAAFAAAGVTSIEELRAACVDARRQGLQVFRPCGYTKPAGFCAGHVTDQGKPERRVRSRRAGERLPEGTVCVTRGTRWGNPYVVKRVHGQPRVVGPRGEDEGFVSVHEAHERAVDLYERALRAGHLSITVADVQSVLRGKDLACFCAEGKPCHADRLLQIANEGA